MKSQLCYKYRCLLIHPPSPFSSQKTRKKRTRKWHWWVESIRHWERRQKKELRRGREREGALSYCSQPHHKVRNLCGLTMRGSERARVKHGGKAGDNEDFINQCWYKPSFITPLLKAIQIPPARCPQKKKRAWLWQLSHLPSSRNNQQKCHPPERRNIRQRRRPNISTCSRCAALQVARTFIDVINSTEQFPVWRRQEEQRHPAATGSLRLWFLQLWKPQVQWNVRHTKLTGSMEKSFLIWWKEHSWFLLWVTQKWIKHRRPFSF